MEGLPLQLGLGIIGHPVGGAVTCNLCMCHIIILLLIQLDIYIYSLIKLLVVIFTQFIYK